MTGVSIVIPLRNESGSLSPLLESLRAQRRPANEVILVDGGSTDGTAALARRLTIADSTMRLVEAGPATPGRGRNVGRGLARQAWIAFTDGGTVADPLWLERLAAAVEDHPDAQVAYGTYEPVVRTFLDSCAVGTYVPPRRARGPSTASLLIHVEALDRAGGFPDLRAAEDLILFERLADLGVGVAWAPDAIVHWQLPTSLPATWRRFRLYSRHNVDAGRQRHWHRGVARIYAGGVVIVGVGLLTDRRVLILAAVGPLARAVKRLWGHRIDRGLAFVVNPARILGVVGLTAVVDAATLSGWLDARRPRWTPRRRAASALTKA